MLTWAAKVYRRNAGWLRWVFHVLAVLLTVVLLGYLNWAWRLDRLLLSPFPRLHPYWLPLIFLLLYGFGWLAWWIAQMLGPRAETGEFPDIDEAWLAGLAALERANIEPTEVPLFLILGRPAGDLDDLFAAAGIALQVRGVPNSIDAPLRVFANRHAIFVALPGASLLARHTELILAEAPRRKVESPTLLVDRPRTQLTETPEVAEALTADALTAALGFDVSATKRVASSPAIMATVTEPVKPVADELADVLGPVKPTPDPDDPALSDRPPAPLLQQSEEVDRLTRRLSYLCRLLSRRRQPYCPINGLMWLIPLPTTDPSPSTERTAAVVRRERLNLRDALQVDAPSVAVVTDMDRLPGFAELLRNIPVGPTRERLVGRTFPLWPDLNFNERAAMIDSGLQWFESDFLPALVYRLYRLEKPGEDRWKTAEANMRLFQLLAEVRLRRATIGRILSSGLSFDDPALVDGVYFVASGADSKQQAFASAPFAQIIANQNYVQWTDDARREDRDYERITWLGYAGMVGTGLALIVFGWLVTRT